MIRRASIPGRINIIGEHTDYAGGVSLAFASQHRLILEAEFIDSGIYGDQTVVELWKEADGPPARLEVNSTIPIGKGMSSSAALCLSIVLCIHGDSINKQDACEEAQRLEHIVLGTQCGLLDQMTMMYSMEHHCTMIDFSSLETKTIPFPPTWKFKIIDSEIHRTLNSHDYRQTASEETKQLHVQNENERVHCAINSTKEQLGKLLNATHESLMMIGVSTAEIDSLVQSLQNMDGVLGARMMGGGFGGMILVLVEDEDVLFEHPIVIPSRPGFVEELI
ncbi:MAG: Galactokinase [Euryarchaeota archaeon UBA443]|jgi:galactokinase|nr:MAG: Galactokinase [Euryarchaeota archaeon UBA443]|tara:strand:- start:2553 stop:3386 length:834 start_codon:yes stop_codon:yes gene_type:complete